MTLQLLYWDWNGEQGCEPGFPGGHPCPFFLAVCRNTSTVCFPQACFIRARIQQVILVFRFLLCRFYFQENVSCLNTSLVILMLARRKEKLPFYLRTLQQMEYTEKYPGFILNNFHSLLRFWQQHYLNKDKDSTCLENVCDPLTMAGVDHSNTCLPVHWQKWGVGGWGGKEGRKVCPQCNSCGAFHTFSQSGAGFPCEQRQRTWLWHTEVTLASAEWGREAGLAGWPGRGRQDRIQLPD